MKSNWKKQFKEEFGIHFKNSSGELDFAIAFIEHLLEAQAQDKIGRVLIKIEEEKTRLYNNDEFYGELEKIFGLLSRLQEEITKLKQKYGNKN